MGLDDKLKEAAGKVKETVGAATDNDSLEREGERDQASAKVEGAVDEVKDGLSDAKDRLK